MSTDASTQQAAVIAKDLIIAALETKQLHLAGGGPAAVGTQLGEAYVALLNRIKGTPQASKG